MKSPPGSEPGWVSSAYVAYWLPVNLMAAATPKAMKSQPTGLYGLREATRAPTVAKGTAVERTRGTRATSLTGHSKNPRNRPATIRAHKGQANQAALRPDSPTPRLSCSLAPSVTTPLYSTTASQALRSGDLPVREAREKAWANLYRFRVGGSQAIQRQRCRLGKHNPRPGEGRRSGVSNLYPGLLGGCNKVHLSRLVCSRVWRELREEGTALKIASLWPLAANRHPLRKVRRPLRQQAA